MLKTYSTKQLAQQLHDAQTSRAAISPLSVSEPEISIDEAYAVQMENVKRCTDAGLCISGKKIGLTSLAMQEMFGVNEPDYGHLFDSMDMRNGEIPADTLLQPRIEAEIAFILGQDIEGPDATPAQVLAATDYVAAALEIVDSRISDWKIKLVDTVADNASSGCYVLSEKRVAVSDISLPDVQMIFYKNGEEMNRGAGTAVLGDPALCVAWLANKLWKYGVTLKKGEVVLSGALSAAINADCGDVFKAEMTGLGTVSARFV